MDKTLITPEEVLLLISQVTQVFKDVIVTHCPDEKMRRDILLETSQKLEEKLGPKPKPEVDINQDLPPHNRAYPDINGERL